MGSEAGQSVEAGHDAAHTIPGMRAVIVFAQLAGLVVGGVSPSLTDKLHVFPWQVYPDMVVFDWFIKLADKDRMVGCDLTYGLETDNGVGNASIVENFLPSYRTFKIFPLRSNSSYWLYMTCKDREGGWHVSDTTSFTTGVAMMVAEQPAAVHSSLSSQQGLVETLNRGMFSVRPTNNVSPHMLMGVSCLVLSVVVLTVSSVLLARRYRQGKTYQLEIEKEIKAFEEVENGLACEDVNMKECCTEEYVDIDSYNEDSLTLQSDDIHDNEEEEEEDEDESSKY